MWEGVIWSVLIFCLQITLQLEAIVLMAASCFCCWERSWPIPLAIQTVKGAVPDHSSWKDPPINWYFFGANLHSFGVVLEWTWAARKMCPLDGPCLSSLGLLWTSPNGLSDHNHNVHVDRWHTSLKLSSDTQDACWLNTWRVGPGMRVLILLPASVNYCLMSTGLICGRRVCAYVPFPQSLVFRNQYPQLWDEIYL